MNAAAADEERVDLVLYRMAGHIAFLRVQEYCRECELSYLVLMRLMDEVFAGKPVSLNVKPWLSTWWEPLLHGGWHAPILMLNGRVFSQGRAVDPEKLIAAVGAELGDDSLVGIAETYRCRYDRVTTEADIVLYHSPACPHCRRLKAWLDEHDLAYAERDVSTSVEAREDLHKLTNRLQVPVLELGTDVIVGCDPLRLAALFDVTTTALTEHPWPSPASAPPELETKDLLELVNSAKDVLDTNWNGRWTRPSPSLHPHQWSCVSGFAARAYMRYAPERAYAEIRSLFRAQWADGFLPHIVFNPEAADRFPGPDYWQAQRSERVPDGILTSGIGQPPVHASMVAAAAKLDPDSDRARDFLEDMYPRLDALHSFYLTSRDATGEGLVAIVHPWESVTDNTLTWDGPLSRIDATSAWARDMRRRYDALAAAGECPKRPYIEIYSYLVQALFETHYDWQRIMGSHPFRVQDVLFNTILCRAERDLARIADNIGRDALRHHARADHLAQAMNEKLWDPNAGVYWSCDLVAGAPIRRETVFSFLPLYADVPNSDQTQRMIHALRAHCFCIGGSSRVAIPIYDLCQADAEGELYWRGPVWPTVSWYLAAGLKQAGELELATWLDNSLLSLIHEKGFYEDYSPDTGNGLGERDFSQTAAVAIELACRRLEEQRGV